MKNMLKKIIEYAVDVLYRILGLGWLTGKFFIATLDIRTHKLNRYAIGAWITKKVVALIFAYAVIVISVLLDISIFVWENSSPVAVLIGWFITLITIPIIPALRIWNVNQDRDRNELGLYLSLLTSSYFRAMMFVVAIRIIGTIF